jgi:hypothetical protein
MSKYRSRGQNRFENYREITAKFDSKGSCGHAIKRGDVIGWHKTHGAKCPDCWSTWSAENAAAAQDEAMYAASYGAYGAGGY